MERFSYLDHLRRAAIWLGLAAAMFLVWRLRNALLLVFAAYLISLLLRLLATLLGRITRLPRGCALALAVVLVFGVALGSVWLFGASLADQLQNVLTRARAGYTELDAFLHKNGIDLSSIEQSLASMSTAKTMLSYILDGAEVVVLLVIMSLYLSAEPRLYHRGIALLFPERMRAKAIEAVDGIASWLELWMLGQLVLMAVVGLGSYIALVFLGVSSPGALGLIAGLSEAVPYLGPFIGAVPAILVALTQGAMTTLYVAGAYLVLHLIEGYVVGPMLQRRFALIPPAVILAGIFACQLVFGLGGVVLAAPLTVAIYAAAKLLYQRNTLNQDVEPPEAPKLEA